MLQTRLHILTIARPATWLICVLLVFTGAAVTQAATTSPLAVDGPIGPTLANKTVADLDRMIGFAMDIDALRQEDRVLEAAGSAPRFAVPEPVAVTPENAGTWETLDERFMLWRYRITAPGALSLNLGFTRYELPKGARLNIYPADTAGKSDPRGFLSFDSKDNELHGELWTPVVLADDIIVELLLPTANRYDYALNLTSVNKGYRIFGESSDDKSGSCNVDVVCSEGDDWWDEINANAVISTGGSLFCSGSMLNNTAEDGTPYFVTAYHCGVTSSNASSLVVYWNFQSPTCGQQGGGSLSQSQTGSYFRASNSSSDFTLVELDDDPNPAYNVTFAGWNRSSGNPSSATAIHHPNCDEKSISFEYDATSTTSYLGTSTPGDGTHIRITDWDVGTTEAGSSGSPLYDPYHRFVGQLHGGYAACGNDESDWYGRFSVSWSSASSYLDPLGTGATTLDTYDPNASGMRVTPSEGLAASGDVGGPFTPSSQVYTLENNGSSSISFSAGIDVAWATVTGGSGTIAAGGSASVTVSINSAANSLSLGGYSGTITFTNLTDGNGDTTRPVTLEVGAPSLVYSFPLDSDPGWSTEGQWAFGVPLGGGGQYGNDDPTSGHTGSYVYGYNLAGDYANNLSQMHLVSEAIDCTDLSVVSLKFWRWLNVEVSDYDHASLSVSNDGSNWTTLWANGDEVTDSSWSQFEYDISAVADGEPTVYLRWTMGTTDGSWQYSGWNIDDIEIWGLDGSTSPADDTPALTLRLGNHPNPFNPVTRIDFALNQTGPVVLGVYDVQGRLVRSLVSEVMSSGEHSAIWNGLNERGLPAGSGVYFARLSAGDQLVEHKMLLLK